MATFVPDFDSLPPVKGMPKGCAWGLWGAEDQLGTLNLLSPATVLAARQEIQEGTSVALNWEITKNLQHPPTARCSTSLKIIDSLPTGAAFFDDEIVFNPQSGSQIDGLKHCAHQATKSYYNGLTHDDILRDQKSPRNGIGNISERGGIVARGVLLDFQSYAERHNISFSPITRHIISIEQLTSIAEEQKVELRPGDVLIVRMGFTKWHDAASSDERKRGTRTGTGEFVGVEANEESARWFWNQHFSMVACDSMAFEVWPPASDGSLFLHEYMIAFWGMSIGELWDLEKLADTCKSLGRWSFFFTSAPLNVAGGVSSPPNALAIF